MVFLRGWGFELVDQNFKKCKKVKVWNHFFDFTGFDGDLGEGVGPDLKS